MARKKSSPLGGMIKLLDLVIAALTPFARAQAAQRKIDRETAQISTIKSREQREQELHELRKQEMQARIEYMQAQLAEKDSRIADLELRIEKTRKDLGLDAQKFDPPNYG